MHYRIYMCLVTKKGHVRRITKFGPTNLSTLFYKIMTNVSWRLKKVLSSTITEFEPAFVGGKQMINSCLISNELIDERKSAVIHNQSQLFFPSLILGGGMFLV